MAPTFTFRVDSGHTIGSGHLYRSIALADELRRLGGDVTWICRDHPGSLHGLLSLKGYQVYVLPALSRDASPDLDAKQTMDVLTNNQINPDWIIVDHYEIDRRWTQKIRPCTRAVMQIDDLANRPLDCDILLDQTVGRHPDDYRPFAPESCRFMFGGAYTLLRPEFRRWRSSALKRRQSTGGDVRQILISMGSVDQPNYTATALLALSQCRFEGDVCVVLGKDAPHQDHVKQTLRNHFPHGMLILGTEHMAQLMTRADLAIGAGGLTSWERCCLGLPTVVVEVADNQKDVIAALEKNGAALCAGKSSTTDDKELAKYIHALLNHKGRVVTMGQNAARLCDGLGARRAALTLIPVHTREGKPVTLRPAEIDDCRLIYSWQCHPNTRRFARRPQVPSFSQHQQWFEAKLRDPSCVFNIIRWDGKSAGVLRLDKLEQGADEDRAFEISIFIDPSAYRRGIAEAALAAVRLLIPEADLYAEVLPENQASQRLFEKMDYVHTDTNNLFVNKGVHTLD